MSGNSVTIKISLGRKRKKRTHSWEEDMLGKGADPEGVGYGVAEGGYDKNTLYECTKLSKNK